MNDNYLIINGEYMKITKLKLYLITELVLFIVLLIFQIIYISQGYLLRDKSGDLFIGIAIMHIAVTLVSFVFATYILLINRNDGRIREDLFPIYFLFAFIADIFFSFTGYLFMGHICFIITYAIFMFIRKAKIYEYIGVLAFGVIALVVVLVINKLNLTIGLDCFLAPLLLLNMVMCIIRYIKEKNKANLLLMIALILIVVSDSSIVLSTFGSNAILVNAIALLIWPTYIAGCSLLNWYYSIKRNVENR